jgi:3-oxoacyl-[acyl-carrier-protein] synthase II
MKRVVVSGAGLLTPLGTGVEPNWEALLAGKSAVGPLHNFDPSSLRTQVGAEIDDFEPKDFITNRRTLRMMTRADQFALAGAVLAVQDAGIEFDEESADRVALFVGSNKELCNPLHLVEPALSARNPDGTADIRKLGETATSTFHPLFYVEGLQAASLFFISDRYGLKGANTYFAGTGETGAVAIGRAFRAVKRGEADIAIAGGYDDAASWYPMTKFDTLGILTGRNDLGATSVKPFDAERDGTACGEGAAFVVLEELESAVRRGARTYAEIVGLGSSFDAGRLLTPDREGRPLARALRSALGEAEAQPEWVGYVAAHGSGTRLGDASEACALHAIFNGNGAGPAVSSVKAATGDLVAAAGALNIVVAALVLRDQIAPPTLNLERPDPRCAGVDFVTQSARELELEYAIGVARGLEGQNVALVMRATGQEVASV